MGPIWGVSGHQGLAHIWVFTGNCLGFQMGPMWAQPRISTCHVCTANPSIHAHFWKYSINLHFKLTLYAFLQKWVPPGLEMGKLGKDVPGFPMGSAWAARWGPGGLSPWTQLSFLWISCIADTIIYCQLSLFSRKCKFKLVLVGLMWPSPPTSLSGVILPLQLSWSRCNNFPPKEWALSGLALGLVGKYCSWAYH